MPLAGDDIQAFLRQHPQSVLVEVVAVQGSAPRDVGTWMLVARDRIFRTIGGGQLEFLAIDHARTMLAGEVAGEMTILLGPEIGQCCGGKVRLQFSHVDAEKAAALAARIEREIAARPCVYVFGAGHVGNALAKALSLTPMRTILVDTREAELAAAEIDGIDKHHVAMPENVVRHAPANSSFIVLTHDHALDFLIAAEALRRGDAAYVGMIGSKTKRATFRHWLQREMGLELPEHFACPVGSAVVKDKRPEIIAALATAEIISAVCRFQ
ncbi:xanthine dehydrogenase accessory protein XdhC [Daeguia caeni]|uniref:Xanthine dehydrogenase accessory protein XdhC n=1 Tax=Daeguia caeni TaxID=439612 RepID=A0ABV9H732_9HYPH